MSYFDVLTTAIIQGIGLALGSYLGTRHLVSHVEKIESEIHRRKNHDKSS